MVDKLLPTFRAADHLTTGHVKGKSGRDFADVLQSIAVTHDATRQPAAREPRRESLQNTSLDSHVPLHQRAAGQVQSDREDADPAPCLAHGLPIDTTAEPRDAFVPDATPEQLSGPPVGAAQDPSNADPNRDASEARAAVAPSPQTPLAPPSDMALPASATPGSADLAARPSELPTVAGESLATTSARDASPRSPSPPPLPLLHRGGDVELIDVPWHLAGNGRLSYLRAGVPIAAGSTIVAAEEVVEVAADTTQATASSDGDAGTLTSSALEWADGAPGQGARNLIAHATDSESPAGRITATTLRAGLPLAWAARRLRWLGGGDGEVTAWLRDFHLGADAHAAIIHALCAQAARDGKPLTRIVLNGHEIWRAPDRA